MHTPAAGLSPTIELFRVQSIYRRIEDADVQRGFKSLGKRRDESSVNERTKDIELFV